MNTINKKSNEFSFSFRKNQINSRKFYINYIYRNLIATLNMHIKEMGNKQEITAKIGKKCSFTFAKKNEEKFFFF